MDAQYQIQNDYHPQLEMRCCLSMCRMIFFPRGSLAGAPRRRGSPGTQPLHSAVSSTRLAGVCHARLAPATALFLCGAGRALASTLRGHTPGAEFAAGLQLPPATVVISKAKTVAADAYSGFGGQGSTVFCRTAGFSACSSAGWPQTTAC